MEDSLWCDCPELRRKCIPGTGHGDHERTWSHGLSVSCIPCAKPNVQRDCEAFKCQSFTYLYLYLYSFTCKHTCILVSETLVAAVVSTHLLRQNRQCVS